MFIPSKIHPVSLNGTQLFKWRLSILFTTFTGSLAATLSNLSSSSTPITHIYAQHDKVTLQDNTANYKANKDMFLPRNRIIFSRSLLGFPHMSTIKLSTVVLDAETPTRSNSPAVTELESFHFSKSLAGPDAAPLDLRTILQGRSTTSANLPSLIPFIIFGAILGTSVIIGLASVILWHFRKSKKSVSTRLPSKNQPWDLSRAYRLSRHMTRDQRSNCMDIDNRYCYDTKNRTRLQGMNGTSISSRSIMSDYIDLEQRSPRHFHYNVNEENYHSSFVSDYINKSDSRAKPEDWLTDLKKKLELSPDWKKKTKGSVNRCSSFLNLTQQNIQSQMEHHHKQSSKKKKPAGIKIDEFDDDGWSYDQLPDFFHASNCDTPRGTNTILIDPLPRPQAATPKTNSCMADICREQSSRFYTHPTDSFETETTTNISLIAPTHDTYRDTMYSISFTTNERRDKGWSDPFDLDMPEFRRKCERTNEKHTSARQSPLSRNLSVIDNKITPTFI